MGRIHPIGTSQGNTPELGHLEGDVSRDNEAATMVAAAYRIRTELLRLVSSHRVLAVC